MDSYEFDHFYQSYLSENEFVVWKGKPEKGNYLTSQDWFAIPFGLFFLGFSLFWEFSALSMGAPFFFSLFGLFFVGNGLYLSVGRFFHAAALRPQSFYVITNKKLLIKRGSAITIYTAANLPEMNIHLHKNGNGTITFTEYVYSRRGRRSRSISLENIPEPYKAQNAILSMER